MMEDEIEAQETADMLDQKAKEREARIKGLEELIAEGQRLGLGE